MQKPYLCIREIRENSVKYDEELRVYFLVGFFNASISYTP